MYELVCHNSWLDETRFRGLFDHPIVSTCGHHTVTTEKTALRKSLDVGSGLFVESNLSANGIRDVVRCLLVAFDMPPEKMQVFLRQDRDAGRD